MGAAWSQMHFRWNQLLQRSHWTQVVVPDFRPDAVVHLAASQLLLPLEAVISISWSLPWQNLHLQGLRIAKGDWYEALGQTECIPKKYMSPLRVLGIHWHNKDPIHTYGSGIGMFTCVHVKWILERTIPDWGIWTTQDQLWMCSNLLELGEKEAGQGTSYSK